MDIVDCRHMDRDVFRTWGLKDTSRLKVAQIMVLKAAVEQR